ncbi:MAG TPA: cytochrome c oxidase subunit II [Candidatus Angelobacter sp.]|nr:cytochrome c oxidase subunit II [Candidatus Angelobacter sp.]
MAGQEDALFVFLLALSAVMTAAIFITIFVFALKYRRRPGHKATQIHGSWILETAWSVIPMGIFLIIFAWGAWVYYQEHTPPQDADTVYTVAKQWMWKFQHEDGQQEIDELHVPLNRDIRLIMTSQDVIHSFFVPAFRVKQDVLPGRYTTVWFRATTPGTYHLFCTQYCGTQHSGMIGQVVVMEPKDYQAWLTQGGTFHSLSAQGESLFQQLSCDSCHHNTGVQGRGPNLTGIYGSRITLEDGRTVIADEAYIRESILSPAAKVASGFKPIMPVFQGVLNEDEVNVLVEYIKSLGAPPAGNAGTPSMVPAGTQPQNY